MQILWFKNYMLIRMWNERWKGFISWLILIVNFDLGSELCCNFFRHCPHNSFPAIRSFFILQLWCVQESFTLSHPQVKVKLSSVLHSFSGKIRNSLNFAHLLSSVHMELLVHHSYQDTQSSDFLLFLGLSSLCSTFLFLSSHFRSASFYYFLKAFSS